MIEVKDLSFRYEGEDENVLNNISLSVQSGEFVAIVGHNGCGKSTLAKLFNALLVPTEGDVIVDGMNTKDPAHTLDVRKTAGMIFQNPDNQMVATLVEEEIAFGPENLGLDRAQIRKRVDDALKTMAMEDYRRAKPHELSGGQKQRVAIASVLAMHPKYIIFDEATAMLDPKGRSEVLLAIEKLRMDGVAIIYITHYMEEITSADRVIVLNEGKVFMIATPRELFSNVEKLRSIDLDVPQAAMMAYELSQRNVNVGKDIIEVKELVDSLCQ